jgi:hypothetical protein
MSVVILLQVPLLDTFSLACLSQIKKRYDLENTGWSNKINGLCDIGIAAFPASRTHRCGESRPLSLYLF